MFSFIFWRIVQIPFILAAIYTITFLMTIVVPGNPFQQTDRNVPEAVQRAVEARYGADDNFKFFYQYIWGAVRGDFGPSWKYQDWTCNQLIGAALPVSLALGMAAMLIATVGGVTAGVIGAVDRNGVFDALVGMLVLVGISLPLFVTGTVLLLVFAIKWPLLPVAGWGSISKLVLPAVTLSLPFAAYIARLTRVGLIDVLSSDFVRTARAKGVGETSIVLKHALKNAFLPVLSYLGPATAAALTGSFVVEKVFAVPGLGQHFVNAVLNQDRVMVLGTVLLYSVIIVVFNLIVDVLYVFVDPRVDLTG